jgi:very-short-patch-repair endonuclease
MTQETTARARAMRKSLTPPEARMWAALKKLRAQGYHFRRQAPLLGYYLDFVCFDRRLIIEVDGASHTTDQGQHHDARRDAVFAREGFTTLRFTNASVRDHFPEVLEAIVGALRHGPTRARLRLAVPPHEGEGE